MSGGRHSFFRSSGGLFCLLAAVLLAAGGMGTVSGETEIQVLNASGNLNIKPSVDPIGKSDGYSATLYNIRNGLPTSEANAIAQTGEGFIWIGSYSGLIRYDGDTFERISPATGIANVRCLYVDSRDRLWGGTNDSGVFLISKGDVRNWDKSDGLDSVSIRALTEDPNGWMVVGSTDGISMIDPAMNLYPLKDERIAGKTIRDLRRGNDGLIYGLTQNGDIFTLQDGKIVTFLSWEECRVKGVCAILPDPREPGKIYLGTEQSTVYYGSLEKNFASMGMKDISPLGFVEQFELIDGEIWICTRNGIGNLDAEGFHRMKNVPMDSAIEHVMTDYEGNLWFTSSKQGIMKIVPNRFSDLSERYDLPVSVVNSTCMYGRQLFIGTDAGLIVVDNGDKLDHYPLKETVTASGSRLDTDDLLAYLDGVRVRSVIRDSKGRLWISTWRRYGLLCFDQGKMTVFSDEDGLFSNQVRVVSECEDGSMLVVNTGGVSVIQDGRVTAGYGENAGINTDQILTVTEGFNHEVILGTDGNGIFIVGGGETRHIGKEEGLDAEVILRIKRSRSRDIYWIVTSNSLAYMTPDYQVTTIREFPYATNYDLYENSMGDAWVLSSNGIYVARVEELLANEKIEPVFCGINSGLPYEAVANSYSELTAEGDLYISGSLGVIKVNIEKPFQDINETRIALPFADIDGTRIYPDESGGFSVPYSARRLTLYPYVFNYSLVDPQVSYRLDGFDTADTTVTRAELGTVDYTNLAIGTYHFIITVRDSVGHSDKTVSFGISKGKEISVGTSGTIIMNLTALFLMTGILFYTSTYRKRGRMDDKLFFGMVLVNMTMAAVEVISYLQEGSQISFMKELMYLENTVDYAMVEIFPFLFLLYLDYRIYEDTERLKKVKLLYGIPLFLFLVILILNLRTGWIFSITKRNIYRSGSADQLVFVPLLFYLLILLIRVYRIDRRLVIPGILLIGFRILLDLWTTSISSMAVIYSIFLLGALIHVINQPTMNEEAL